jgi:hypothetical protein
MIGKGVLVIPTLLILSHEESDNGMNLILQRLLLTSRIGAQPDSSPAESAGSE